MKCFCNNKNEIWVFNNQVVVIPPFDVFSMTGEKKEFISIDACILSEIAYLWYNWIITLNSCCWHRKNTPSVIVTKESVGKMLELWYVIEKIKAKELNSFTLKTKIV